MNGYGAEIERGRIITAENDGYTVMSYTRDNIIIRPSAARRTSLATAFSFSCLTMDTEQSLRRSENKTAAVTGR